MSTTTDLYVVSSTSAAHPSQRQPWPLPASFESPFVGKSVDSDLAPLFKSSLTRNHTSDTDRFPDFTFGVIDEQTLKDGTVLCVSILAGKPETLRADVEIAAMVMLGPEVSGSGLTEGLKPERDGIFYERLDEEKRKHYLEGSEDEDEEDEGEGDDEE